MLPLRGVARVSSGVTCGPAALEMGRSAKGTHALEVPFRAHTPIRPEGPRGPELGAPAGRSQTQLPREALCSVTSKAIPGTDSCQPAQAPAGTGELVRLLSE